MAKTELSNYNLAELKGLQFDIEKEIKSRQQDEVKNGAAKNGGAQQGQARFRNPADASQTWTGRGRQPKWIAEGLAGGKSLDDFRV
jgi:DNA-binding protein H-NS